VNDAIMLSNVDNFVFTGARIRLPDTRPITTARIQPSVESPLVKERDVHIPVQEARNYNNNMTVRVGPLDIWIKKDDVKKLFLLLTTVVGKNFPDVSK